MSLLVPTVIEQTAKGERAFDIWSRLLNQRLIFFGTQLDDTVANLIIAQLLHLEAEDPGKDIRLYINSPGGDMTALFAIYDTMQLLRCDVATFCIGQAASAAAVILAGGTKGKRFALPNSRVLIHQPHGGAQGQTKDMELAVKEMVLHARAHDPGPRRGHRPDRSSRSPSTSTATSSSGARTPWPTAWSTRSSTKQEPLPVEALR